MLGDGMRQLENRLKALEARSDNDDQEIYEITLEETIQWIQEVLSGPDPLAWIENASREECEARLRELDAEAVSSSRASRVRMHTWGKWWEDEQRAIRERLSVLA